MRGSCSRQNRIGFVNRSTIFTFLTLSQMVSGRCKVALHNTAPFKIPRLYDGVCIFSEPDQAINHLVASNPGAARAIYEPSSGILRTSPHALQ